MNAESPIWQNNKTLATIPEKKRKRNPNIALSEAQIRALLNSVDNLMYHTMLALGLTIGCRISEVVSISLNNVDFERNRVVIWDEKKDLWRPTMPTLAVLNEVKRYINTVQPKKMLFNVSKKTLERRIQEYSLKGLGFTISWHSVRTTYITRSVELEIPPAIVCMNTGDSPATILKYYTKMSEYKMREYVEKKDVLKDML